MNTYPLIEVIYKEGYASPDSRPDKTKDTLALKWNLPGFPFRNFYGNWIELSGNDEDDLRKLIGKTYWWFIARKYPIFRLLLKVIHAI